MLTTLEAAQLPCPPDADRMTIEGLEALADHEIRSSMLHDDWPAALNLADVSDALRAELLHRAEAAGWLAQLSTEPDMARNKDGTFAPFLSLRLPAR